MPSGGARVNAGRKAGVPIKPPEELKSRRVVIRLTPAQEQELKERVKALGVSLPKYIKRKLEIID